jgi:prolyl-tRNA synthetase
MNFAENWMGLPVIRGKKTESERFAGAVDTYAIEALMQDGKALQSGTSHFLGQNFAKAFDVQFTNRQGKLDWVWATSWGVSTRLMGALIMGHSDDNGLILPPKLAPIQVVIIPIYKGNHELGAIGVTALKLKKELEDNGISVNYDDRDTHKPGWKFTEYEMKGIPVRLALGPRDIQNNTVEVARRDTLEKASLPQENIIHHVKKLLEDIQTNMFTKALKFRNKNIYRTDDYQEFKEIIQNKGGFILAHWDGTTDTENQIKEETKATIRCIPLDAEQESGQCIYTGRPSSQRVLFAKAY